MNVRDIAPNNLILLLGSPRSGTTWIAKIFDSHPRVLYRHEPDKFIADPMLRRNFGYPAYASLLERAERYVRDLIGSDDLRAAGIRPIFEKSYYKPGDHLRRVVQIWAFSGLERIGAARLLGPLRVPDRIDPARSDDIKVVVKSVAAEGRARLLVDAMPGCRVIFIVRDPFGHIASMRRGSELGMFQRRTPLDECLGTEQAARYGLDWVSFAKLTNLEQHAWHWALHNEKALDDLEGIQRAMVVRYNDVCRDPVGMVKTLFRFVDLNWNVQTAAFVHASTQAEATEKYYKIFRNTATNLERWRKELTVAEQSEIAGIVRQTKMGKLFAYVLISGENESAPSAYPLQAENGNAGGETSGEAPIRSISVA